MTPVFILGISSNAFSSNIGLMVPNLGDYEGCHGQCISKLEFWVQCLEEKAVAIYLIALPICGVLEESMRAKWRCHYMNRWNDNAITTWLHHLKFLSRRIPGLRYGYIQVFDHRMPLPRSEFL